MPLISGFVHGLLAWGALLAAVPLLIHLLNRQRHQPLAWAAMRFVQEAYRRTRRHAQLENLLLLLLRMGAVALLAFAVARPFTDPESPLAPLTESRRDVALVLDVSASTGYRENVRSVHEAIVERARELLGALDGTRGDRVRLILAAADATVAAGRSPEDALAVLSTVEEPADAPFDAAAALGEVARLAADQAGDAGRAQLEVRLLTDLQRRSFVPDLAAAPPGESAPSATPSLQTVLDRLEELGVTVVVEDLGPAALTPPNLGVAAVLPLGDVLGAGLPLEIGVRVQNFGTAGRNAVRVALEVDGERQPSRAVDVPARGAAQAAFPLVLREPGDHTLLARLEGDRLAADDTRAGVLRVPPPVRVLLVDGDPRDEIDLDEVGYLRAILDPPDDAGVLAGPGGRLYSPFAARTITAAALGDGEADIQEADIVVLANVAGLSRPAIEALEGRVAAGAALLVTAGDRLAEEGALEALNARLWRADGSGLLPARLVRIVQVADRRESYYRPAWFAAEHPAFSFFADERWRPYLTEIPIYAFLASVPGEGSRVLARLDDELASPLLVERDYDRGRVFLWTTSIDKGWTRLPESPTSFVPLVHELLRYAAAGVETPRNVPVGGTLVAEVAAFPRGPVLVHPDGTRRELAGEPAAVVEGTWRLPDLSPLERAGLWRIEMEGAPAFPFAVELDPGEGDLERLDGRSLQALHPALVYFEVGAEGGPDEDAAPPDQGELWRWCAGASLAFLILETLWAAWIGRGRRLA
ncbi:MAG: BatA domain-containing protein [Planctomycetota bacterium]